jgi:hypothetical protein
MREEDCESAWSPTGNLETKLQPKADSCPGMLDAKAGWTIWRPKLSAHAVKVRSLALAEWESTELYAWGTNSAKCGVFVNNQC